jgi:hypothetical protein
MKLSARLLLAGLLAGCTSSGRGPHDTGSMDMAMHGGDGSTGGCQGLACFQVDCGNGVTTTISGTVTAPNGTDPVFDALVYVPTSMTEFPPMIQCEVCSEPLGGTPLVQVVTKVDGTFTLVNVPATTAVPIVVQKGRFRKTFSIDTTQCVDNPLTPDQTRLPRNQTEGDLPHVAIGVSDYDQIECVLHGIGIDQGEFTKPTGSGAVHLYANSTSISDGTESLHALLMDPAKMATYNIIFIPCAIPTWQDLGDTATVNKNLFDYVNGGGRLYVTDYSYDYMEQVPQFSPYIFFPGGGDMTNPQPPAAAESYWPGSNITGTVSDPTLAQWLDLLKQANGDKIMLEGVFSVANATAADQMTYPSTTWVHGNDPTVDAADHPLTVSFDYNMCGKVLWSAYHTREPGGASGWGTFPQYCLTPPIPQEKVLEYLILQISACVNNIPG